MSNCVDCGVDFKMPKFDGKIPFAWVFDITRCKPCREKKVAEVTKLEIDGYEIICPHCNYKHDIKWLEESVDSLECHSCDNEFSIAW